MTRERRKYIINTIVRILKLGGDLNTLIETTDITEKECLDILDEIKKLLND